MYSAPYGSAGPGFNGAPAGGGLGANQSPPNQQQQQQQQQHMMYNPQQFPMAAQQGGGPFPGGVPNQAAMMPGAGPAGMMQNTAMQHAAVNGQMAYQTSYTGSPFGQGVPSSAGPQGQLPPNFAMMPGQMPGMPMNGGTMPMQQQQQIMMQRMHPSQQNPTGMGMPTPQRSFIGVQGAPTSLPSQPQSQFVTPQNPQGTPQQPPPRGGTPQAPTSVTTPQTPTFPSASQGAANINGHSSASTPLSPGTESKEKERFAVLLDINSELLFESIQLQNTLQDIKKEHQASGFAAAGEKEKKPSEEETVVQQDYVQCMRRLQTNLSYLAILADRKGSVQIPPCPAYLMAPPLNMSIKIRGPAPSADSKDVTLDPAKAREGRDKYLKDLYRRLQALFPGVDPKKEPAFPSGKAQQGQKGSGSNQASPAPGSGQKTPQMATSAPPQPPPVPTS